MDDSILTILFYVGTILIISLSKYFSKFLKRNAEDTNSVQNNDKSESILMDGSLEHDYFQDRNLELDSNVSSLDSNISILDSSNQIEEGVSVFTPIHTSNNQTINSNTSHFEPLCEVDSYLPFLANFDARAAIIYSEILKRPEY